MSTENNEEKGWAKFKERLQNTYRLVVMNDESFEEVGSYKLSLLNLYVAISVGIVIVATLVVSLIFFTPIKRMVPGYGDASSGDLLEVSKTIAELEKELQEQKNYTESFRRMITGDDETENDVKEEKIMEIDTLQTVEIIEEDEILRQEVEEEFQSQQRMKLGAGKKVFSNDVPLDQLYLMPPITGIVSEQFMPDKKHYGTDILAPKNTPVKATMDGFIISSDWTLETGNTISIQHSNNLISCYKHNSALLKKIGDFVKAGEAVAIIGNTGTLSNGPHLHFELWHKGKPINPEDFITFE